MPLAPFPPHFFDRLDASDDGDFYGEPRLVTHIDDATIAALTHVYREMLPANAGVLDLMSSWVSHLPADGHYRRVAGLGMNVHELEHNPQLTDFVVHDLNATPELPYPADTFDAVVNAVSVQYLTHPVEVFASMRRVLAPSGIALVAISHRMFPTKAILGWQALDSASRIQLVQFYFQLAGGWEAARVVDRSPAHADPLWVIFARRASGC